MTDSTNAIRQQRFRERQRERDLERVHGWVQAGSGPVLRGVAAALMDPYLGRRAVLQAQLADSESLYEWFRERLSRLERLPDTPDRQQRVYECSQALESLAARLEITRNALGGLTPC